jgi:DNA-binding MarR family transcriptional regulator
MSTGNSGKFDSKIDKIVRAYDVISQAINPLVRLKLDVDLTLPQFKVLMGFEMQARYTMTDLSKENAVTVSTMTSMIERLVQVGLVTRCYDEHDRRKVLVCLTEKGRKTAEQVINFRHRELERFLGGLHAAEITEFVDSIEKTAHFLTKANKSAVAQQAAL